MTTGFTKTILQSIMTDLSVAILFSRIFGNDRFWSAAHSFHKMPLRLCFIPERCYYASRAPAGLTKHKSIRAVTEGLKKIGGCIFITNYF